MPFRRSWLGPAARGLLIQWAVVGVAIGGWVCVTETGLVNTSVLPKVGPTFSALGDIVSTSQGLHNLGVSGLEFLGVFVIATPAAVALGFLLGQVRQRYAEIGNTTDYVFSTLLATPKFVFLPILIVLLGAGYWEKVTYALADGFIILTVGTAAASYTADRQLRLVSRSLRMSNWQFFWKIYLPGSLPVLIEALRLAVILYIGGVLLAEMYISSAGIGYLISQWSSQYNLPKLFAGVILVSIVAITINAGFRAVETRLSGWRSQARTE